MLSSITVVAGHVAAGRQAGWRQAVMLRLYRSKIVTLTAP